MSRRGPRGGSSPGTAKSWRQAAVSTMPTDMQAIHAGKNEPWILMMGSQPATGRGTRATTVNRNHQPRLAIIVTVTMSEHSPGCLHLASGDTLYCARSESGD